MDVSYFFFFQAEDGIRDLIVTGVQTCALPISAKACSIAAAFSSAERDGSKATTAARPAGIDAAGTTRTGGRESTSLDSNHDQVSYAVFSLEKKTAGCVENAFALAMSLEFSQDL